MNPKPKRLICHFVLLIALAFSFIRPAHAQKITLTANWRGPAINPEFAAPLNLDISSPGGADFLLQRSSDLKTWQPYVTVYSRVDQFSLVDPSRTEPFTPITFLTASRSLQTPEEMLAVWRSHNFTAYKFKFYRECFCLPIQLSAVVTVRDGKIVAAENMSDGRGTPGFTAPLNHFKSIEELYAMITAAHGQADILQIGWKVGFPFPTWIYMDRHQPSVDDEITYRISDVVRIE